MNRYIGEIFLTITAIVWGSGFVASAIALESYTPYQILALRFVISVVVLALIFAKKIKFIKRSTIIKGAILGILLYLAFALQTIGLQFTTPSKNAFLTAVNVVIVPFIGYLFYKKKIDKFELGGAFLAMLGVGIISLQLSMEINIGDVLTLLCAVGFAFQIFYTSRFVKDEDPILLTLTQMATAALLGVIVMLFKGEAQIAVNSEGMMAVSYLAVFSTTLAYLLQTYAQKTTTETKTAIILSTEAVWGMVFSIIILSELITTRMVIGAITILIAIILSETKLSFLRKKTKAKPIHTNLH